MCAHQSCLEKKRKRKQKKKKKSLRENWFVFCLFCYLFLSVFVCLLACFSSCFCCCCLFLVFCVFACFLKHAAGTANVSEPSVGFGFCFVFLFCLSYTLTFCQLVRPKLLVYQNFKGFFFFFFLHASSVIRP